MTKFFNYLLIIASAVLLFLLYILMEQAATTAKNKEKMLIQKDQRLINDAFTMGASMYRAQTMHLVDDKVITQMDSLFIQEVRDFNDSLAVELIHEFEL